MKNSDKELIIGARGWNFAHWQDSFYPDGLPEDWRFTYYSNEFHSVLVPWECLQEADSGKIREWLDDTDSSFEFFIEAALHWPWEQLQPIVELLAPQLRGIFLRDVQPKRTALLDIKTVETTVSKVSEQAPIIVDGNTLNSVLQSVVAEYNPGCYWRPDESDITKCNATIALAETTLITSHQPRRLKKIIEDCRSVQGPTTIGFFIGGMTPSVDDIRNASMIWQMLA